MPRTGRQLGGLVDEAHRAAFVAAGIASGKPYRFGPRCQLQRCTATAKSTGLRCRDIARAGKLQCWQHGGGHRPDLKWTARRLRALAIRQVRNARRQQILELRRVLEELGQGMNPTEYEELRRAIFLNVDRVP